MKDYLGCIIEFKGKDDSIHQPHFIKKLESKFKELVKDIRKTTTPTRAPGEILMGPKEEFVDFLSLQGNYRSGMWMLLFLVKKFSQPNIANAVRKHSNMMDGATI